MNRLFARPVLLALLLAACPAGAVRPQSATVAASARAPIDSLVDRWHRAAATADEDVFFGSMTPEAVYLGTDATERWTRPEFERWAMKYFQRESAWAFRPYDRTVYFSADGKTAWWEEHLDTWMGVCGGSGVAVLGNDGWRIAHYHLAVTVPNARIEDFIAITKNPADRQGTPEHGVMEVVRRLLRAIGSGNAVLAGSVLDDGARIVRATERGGTVATLEIPVSNFLESIAAPREEHPDERAWDYRVRLDGPLASAWVRYGFYVDDRLSHCGVDAFELIRRGDGWKIVSLVYTRRTDGCREDE